jgi:hypothetical protein
LCDATSGFGSLTDEELNAFEQFLRYVLRMYIGRYSSSSEADLDAELEKLRLFGRDPIHYARLENNKAAQAE